jgi:predicted ATPase
MRDDLPSGTVTLLFTDVEGSTRLLHALGPDAYAAALAVHRRVVRKACAAEDGVEVDTQGDAFFFAFRSAHGAVAAAQAMTEALADGPIQVRIGLHTGKPLVTGEGYVGDDVHFAARVAASGHGGQVVLSQATRELLDGIALTDLGEHRLKDIDGPVSIFQLEGARFPPLKTISNTNLPRPASSFVGRSEELADVLGLLESGARLLTLTGPGGSGKTRLALEVASTIVPSYKAGVFWIGLASLQDSALVTATIEQTIGAKHGLAEHIAEREMLLLLDNLEHVIEAASGLAALLPSCPNLTLLITSRELLRVQGEVEYEVPPLAPAEAVSLFCARSRLEPSDEIAELCAGLDDLPLALELAAARAKALSPRQILERLAERLDLLRGGRDADPRQQTLRATIEWSCDLLSKDEQLLFCALSVLAGGCTLSTAEEVAGAAVDAMQSLVEKSLLRFSNERYWMLETIRGYAAEQLAESAQADELRQRHARHFLELAEIAEPNLVEYSSESLERLEGELGNIRAALDWYEASGESELVLRLVGALSRFWDEKGHLAEGRRRLERALGDERPTAARAKALNGAADMAVSLGDATTARLRAEEALALHRALGDAHGAAVSQFLLGLALADGDDLASAEQLFDESARQFRALGEEHYTLTAVRMLAWMCYRNGERERGRALHEDNLRRARALGNAHIEASTLGALAMIAVDEGRVDDALSMLRASHRIDRDAGDPIGGARALSRVARVLAVVGSTETAALLLSRAMALYEELGGSLRPWLAEMNDETLTTIRACLDDAAFTDAWNRGRALTPEEAIALSYESIETAASGND